MMLNCRAIDFETYLIGPGAIFPKPVCLSAYDGTSASLTAGMDQMEEVLKNLLESTCTIIAHNATFECGVIYYHFPNLRGALFKALREKRIVCTKINEELINIVRAKGAYKFSLADLVQYYLKKDISASKAADSWRLRYSELEGVPVENWPEVAKQYSIDDSIYAYIIYMEQSKTVTKLKIDIDLSVESSVFLNVMASKGMEVDLEKVAQLKSEVRALLDPSYEFLIAKGMCSKRKGTKAKPASDDELPKKNIKELKSHIETFDIEYMYTKKGSVCVSGEALAYYSAQVEGDEILKAFSIVAKYEKVLTAFVARLEKDKTIYTTYATAKNTGRTSSSSSGLFPSINIQQMPREVEGVQHDVRNCFIPSKPGFKILSIDYGGLELCATAHQLYKEFGRSKMRDMLNEGTEPADPHSRLAARIKNMSYEEFIKRKSELKHVRQLAKPINLGFPGGIGYDTMRKLLWQSGITTRFNILHKSNDERRLVPYLFKLRNEGCKDIRISRLTKDTYALVQDELVFLKRQFFDLYPELEEFLKERHLRYITGEVKRIKDEFGDWKEEPMYKYEVYGFTRDWCTYTAFCNGILMQTPSAIGAKKAVIKVCSKYLDHEDVRPLAFIHDELLFEIRESRIDIIEDISYIMIEEMQNILSTVRINVEASLMDFWQKGDGLWTQKYWRDAK